MPEVPIEPRSGDQAFVTTGLYDAAILHHDDCVGPRDRVQSMRDDQDGPVPRQRGDRLLHEMFRFRIGKCRRFVEDQDRRIGQKNARYRQTLRLAP